MTFVHPSTCRRLRPHDGRAGRPHRDRADRAGRAAPDAFRPQLVTVDTPTRADKAAAADARARPHRARRPRLRRGGAAHRRRRGRAAAAGLATTSASPTCCSARPQNNQVNAAYAARHGQLAAAVGPGHLPHAGRLQRRHGGAGERAPRPGQAASRCRTRRWTAGRSTASRSARTCTARPTGCPTFLMLGVHHAREWPSGEHAMEFAVDLVKNYGTDARITDLVQPVPGRRGAGGERRRLRPVPHRRRAGRPARGRRRRHRDASSARPATPTSARTAALVDGQDTPDGTCARRSATSPGGYGIGVDLNRNYGGYWGGPGASDLFADPTYRGAAAFSEPETQNIRELISGRQVTTLITNHTFSNLVLRPNGAAPDLVPPSEGIPLGDPYDEAALQGARRPDGRAERLHQPARVGALRHHRLHRGLVVQRHRRLRLHLRDRPGRVPPAVPRGGRRVPRRRPVRRQGQPGGVPDRARERRRHDDALGAHRPGARRRHAAAAEDVRHPDLGRRHPGHA